jgi:hypothetical protein
LASPGHGQISAPAPADPEQPTPEAAHAAAFLKSILSNRATHPETFVQKVASRVGISPPALDRACASLRVICQNEILALPKTKPGGRPRSPSMVVAHMRDPRGMGQRKARVPRTPAW